MDIRIAAFSGSLRRESYTTKLIQAFQSAAPGGIVIEMVPIGNLPLINQDLENDLPQTVIGLHKKIKEADAFLFATPEYNRSYSPVIKNAIDWGSRPQGCNLWAKHPAAVVGCSPYSLGAFGAVHHLRQVLVFVDMYTLQQPEFYLSNVADKMDAAGNITDTKTQEMIAAFWQAYSKWILFFTSNK